MTHMRAPPRRVIVYISRSPIIHRRGVVGQRRERSFTAAALSVLDGNDHSPPRRCRSTTGKIIHRRGVVGQRRDRSFTAAALSVPNGNDHSPPRRCRSTTGKIIQRRDRSFTAAVTDNAAAVNGHYRRGPTTPRR